MEIALIETQVVSLKTIKENEVEVAEVQQILSLKKADRQRL